ncbi:unnamed protein product [Ceutorhynchus assimilis]|uniref:Large ribosomal subunit protein mL38 n=1 Tax=Ceutorhynchus assimilis TaxID=467358 RepID=A0A9N9QL05_9CUCU|nr:unnamed protein product [Ceutorhynchus assimilis]
MSKVLLKLNTLPCLGGYENAFALFIRKGHHLRGKPPGVAKSLQQKLSELNIKDPSVHYKVDIGLPPVQVSRAQQVQERLDHLKQQRNDKELERLSRNRKLIVNLEESNKDWLATVGPQHLRKIAEHYGVFKDLFGDAYFYPQVPLNILYDTNQVYYGNIIKPEDASQTPQVTFDSDNDSFWTLIMTNPDGHFSNNDKEYVHWFVANIPGNKIQNGETIVEYLQPFPPKGTGYHRHIFILYKHSKKLDFSPYKTQGLTLTDRTFNTYDFYKTLQDNITPAGLVFFQSDWSPSLKTFYHNVLKMKEPIYEYDFPAPYIRPQDWYPKRKPFNLYLDKYRDPKEINKEFLMRKLKNIHPFKAPKPEPLYPNAQFIDKDVPSWLKTEIKKSRLKWGRINEIE